MTETYLHQIPSVKGYRINRFGEIWSEVHSRFLTPKFRNGYPIFEFYVSGIRKRLYIHRILAELFIPNPDNKAEVNHIDGNKTNNSLINLEWATHQENLQHAHRTGLIKNLPRGERSHFAKLTESQVREIKRSVRSARTLAQVYGIAHQNIQKIKNGQSWAHVIA